MGVGPALFCFTPKPVEDAVIDELGDIRWWIGATREPCYDLDVCDQVLSGLGEKHEAHTRSSTLDGMSRPFCM